MSNTDRRIIETYSNLFEGLSFTNKIELIESLSKSLKTEKTKQENKFYKSFGAFASSKSAEELVLEIKESRKFRKREINF
jgi:hypothetical protein